MNCLPENYFTKYTKYAVKENDIVIALTGATIGKTSIIKELIEKSSVKSKSRRN